MTISLEQLRQRRAETCLHGIRPGECQTCTPAKEEPLAANEYNAHRCLHPSGVGKSQSQAPPAPAAPKRLNTLRPPAFKSGLPPKAGSLVEKVVEVAGGFAEPFTLEALAVACWERWPDLFGLAGYETWYPDTRGVRNALYGAKGLLRRGLIRRVAGGRFEAAKEENT